MYVNSLDISDAMIIMIVLCVLIYINNVWKPENTFFLILTTRELSMRLRTTKHGLPYIALQEEGKKYILQYLQQEESKKR